MMSSVPLYVCLVRPSVSCSYRVARGSKFQDPTRPGPRKSWPDPTRWLGLSMMDKKALLLHDAHWPALTPRWPASWKVLPCFGLTRYMFIQCECIAICTQSPLYISCFQRHCTVTTKCRLTCMLETSVVWLSSYLLWFVHGLAIKKLLC